MRRATILIILLSSIVFSCQQPVKEKKSTQKKKVTEYKIGVNLPLTGNGSYFAQEYKKGLDLVFDFINKDQGKIAIEVIYEDNKLNPKDAVSITKKFLEIDEVDLIMCGYAPIILATIGMVNQYEVPMLVAMSSSKEIATSYEWVFRDFELESQTMPLLAAYVYAGLELRKGSWLVVNDDMGHDAVGFFSEKFNELGGNMLEGEVFEASDLDLRNKINKVMDRDPEFIVVIGRGSAMINVCRQIREIDKEMPIIGSNTLENVKVWEALGESGYNFWFTGPYVDLESSRYVRVNDQFKTKHGYDINWLNLYGISTANYLARGLRESNGDKQALKEFLENLNYQSIRGLLVMNEKSDVYTPHMIYQRKIGKSIPIEIPE